MSFPSFKAPMRYKQIRWKSKWTVDTAKVMKINKNH